MRHLSAPFSTVCVLLALFSLPIPHAYAEDNTVIAVIVSSNAEIAPVSSIAISELRLIYWRKKQYWQGGLPMQPVNLHAEHPLRLLFSKAVLNNLPREQSDYWNEQYFHGVRPPRSVQSEEAMLRYVTDTKGSIGYVDACHADHRVRPILWIAKDQISTDAPERLNCK
jgi:ABC-type phosphate transport system substrate-binding protein